MFQIHNTCNSLSLCSVHMATNWSLKTSLTEHSCRPNASIRSLVSIALLAAADLQLFSMTQVAFSNLYFQLLQNIGFRAAVLGNWLWRICGKFYNGHRPIPDWRFMTKITRISVNSITHGALWCIMSFISVNSFLRKSFNLVQRGSWRVYTRFELRPNSITLSRSRTGSRAGSRAGLRSASELLASWIA